MTRALLALLLILVQFPVAAAPRRRAVQHPSEPVPPAAIVAAATQAAEAALKAGVPAVQVAVSHGGKVIYSEAFGTSDLESATAVTERSVMQAGSLMKQFTAAAILRLAERGALSLDDRIETFVPEFDPRGRTITLRHLLTHTSGLRPNWYPPGPTNPLLSPATREQVIASINAQPFDFQPGTKYSYSNAGYMLAGYAIESITGVPYADFFQTEFALPLGLYDTGVCGTFHLPRPTGYGLFGPGTRLLMPPAHASALISSGSLCSTASDLTRWAHLLATGSVILPASFATMTTASPFFPYGLGVGTTKILGQPAVNHIGAIDGYMSFLLYFTQRDIGIAVLTNAFPTPTPDPEIIGLAVAKAALDAL
jgi:D-alanyl-D-alanine carboxypeptidase